MITKDEDKREGAEEKNELSKLLRRKEEEFYKEKEGSYIMGLIDAGISENYAMDYQGVVEINSCTRKEDAYTKGFVRGKQIKEEEQIKKELEKEMKHDNDMQRGM